MDDSKKNIVGHSVEGASGGDGVDFHTHGNGETPFSLDDNIRAALRDADEKGKLEIVALVTSIEGGEGKLRRIMESDSPLGMVDRNILSIHLN